MTQTYTDADIAVNQAFADGAFLDEFYGTGSGNDYVFSENFESTPPNATPWIITFMLPAPITSASLGNCGEDLVSGVFQVDLNFPLNKGRQSALAKYEEIRRYFKAGRKFTSNDTTIYILSASPSSGRRVDQNYRQTVSINWESRISRA